MAPVKTCVLPETSGRVTRGAIVVEQLVMVQLEMVYDDRSPARVRQ
jgi:hypothetical protein